MGRPRPEPAGRRRTPAAPVVRAAAGLGSALLLAACVETLPGAAEMDAPAPPASPAAPAPASPAPPPPAAWSPSPLESLVAPIALYPDPLVALILAASTRPAEITAASAYLVQYGDPSRVDAQPWDPSVRALAHYPPVLEWMAANLPWTEALGAAFAASPGDAMEAIQRLRARARASGLLRPGPQQNVVDDAGVIEVVPAQPDDLYLPEYDPAAAFAYDSYGYAGPGLLFGAPLAAGIWLDYGFDWRAGRVWHGGGWGWHPRAGWTPPRAGGVVWQPATGSAPRPSSGGAAPGPRPAPARPLPQGHPAVPPARGGPAAPQAQGRSPGPDPRRP